MSSARRFACAFALCSSVAGSATANASELPWWEWVAGATERVGIHAVGSQAVVTTSDGLGYRVLSVYHDPQRAAIRFEYPDRTRVEAVEGRYVWSSDGQVEREAEPSSEAFVLGHQLHAQILFFDRLHPVAEAPVTGRFAGVDCLSVRADGAPGPWKFHYEADGRPLGIEIERAGEEDIRMFLSEWREVSGISLPHLVEMEDGDRRFRYEYETITINEGTLESFRLPDAMLTDEQRLLRLHRIMMDDHFFGRTMGIEVMRADSVLIVSAGEVHRLPAIEFDEVMRGVMSSRDYTVYDDMIRPIVELSDDGSSGQVFVQVHAEGWRFGADGTASEALEFTSAWVSLFEKSGAEWKLTGNVSNFAPR